MPDTTDHFIERQEIDLSSLKLIGRILDIGGGGEGVIGRIKEDSVISIDLRKGELEESPCNTIKIVMDAADLKFIDNTFDIACAFYTFMYVRKEKRELICAETFRVLKSGGQFLIWDVTIPAQPPDGEDFFIVPTNIQLTSNKMISPGYGVGWKGHSAECDDYLIAAEKVGFKINEVIINGLSFFIRLVKD